VTPLMRVMRQRSIQPLLFSRGHEPAGNGLPDLRTTKSRHSVLASGQFFPGGSSRSHPAMADQNANNKDAIVWRLEQGAVLRGNGQYRKPATRRLIRRRIAFDQILTGMPG